MAVRRGLMMQQQQNGYIQNGLIFQLDGINYGEVSGSWIDLISGVVFTASGSVTHNNISFSFPGDTNSFMTGDTANIGTNYLMETIEVCCNRTNTNGVGVIMYGGNSGIRACYGSSDLFAFCNGVRHKRYAMPARLATVSVCEDYAYYNGTQATEGSLDVWNAVGGNVTIGNRTVGRVYPFEGDIYAIRIYNRHLTAAEMLHNQRVDNKRFNLGLNI